MCHAGRVYVGACVLGVTWVLTYANHDSTIAMSAVPACDYDDVRFMCCMVQLVTFHFPFFNVSDTSVRLTPLLAALPSQDVRERCHGVQNDYAGTAIRARAERFLLELDYCSLPPTEVN